MEVTLRARLELAPEYWLAIGPYGQDAIVVMCDQNMNPLEVWEEEVWTHHTMIEGTLIEYGVWPVKITVAMGGSNRTEKMVAVAKAYMAVQKDYSKKAQQKYFKAYTEAAKVGCYLCDFPAPEDRDDFTILPIVTAGLP